MPVQACEAGRCAAGQLGLVEGTHGPRPAPLPPLTQDLHQEPHSLMLFKGGQNCWNVGARQAEVRLTCGLENKLVSADEPATCKYLLTMETPGACSREQGGALRAEAARAGAA